MRRSATASWRAFRATTRGASAPSAWCGTWRISRAATPRRHRHPDGMASGRLWLDPEVELVGVRAVRGDDDIHLAAESLELAGAGIRQDRKSTRLNSSHLVISYAVF